MNTTLLKKLDMPRRPKMAVAAHVALDEARARVIASGAPSLKDLRAKLGGWDVLEVSGRCQSKPSR